MSNRLIVLCSILVVTACDASPTAQAEGAVEMTVLTSLVAVDRGGSEVVVPFTVDNPRSEPLHLATCGGELLVAVERFESGSWVDVHAALCPAVLDMVPIRLGPGERHEGIGRAPSIPGEYRLRLPIWIGGQMDRPGIVVSPPFRVE